MAGRVVVFTRTVEFADLAAGRPARFRAASAANATRSDGCGVVGNGQPNLASRPSIELRTASARASPMPRASHCRRISGDAARVGAGDTSTVTAQTTAEFRASGLTHLTGYRAPTSRSCAGRC